MRASFNAGCISNGLLYVSDNFVNALMAIDLVTGKVDWVAEFPNEKPEKSFLHKRAFNYKGKIIFAPGTGENVHIFDPLKKELFSLSVPKSSDTRFVFNDSFICSDNLWIFPGNLEQAVIKVDLITNDVYTFPPLGSCIGDNLSLTSQSFFRLCKVGNNVYTVLLGGDKIVKFNLDSHNCEVISIGVSNLNSIQGDENDIYICTSNSDVYSWDPLDNTIQHCEIKDKNNIGGSFTVAKSVDGDVYFIPDYGRQILKRTKRGDILDNYDSLLLRDASLNSRGVHYENYTYWNDELVLFPTLGDGVIIIKSNSLRVLICNMEPREVYYKHVLERLSKNNITERDSFNLMDYVNGLSI